MSCISIGMIDKTLFIIIIGCIFCFLSRLLSKPEKAKILLQEPLFANIYISLARFLTIIPYIIIKVRSKNKNTNLKIENANQSINVGYYDKVKEARKGKWKFMLLSSVIYLANAIFFSQSFKIKTNAWIWYILLASLFYYLIFKIRFHKHHYLSSVLIILLGLTIDLITNNLQKEIVDEPAELVMKFLKQVFFSLYNVMAKYVMEKKYVSVYEFSFYVGLFNLVIFLIFLIFDYYFFKLTNYKDCFKDFDTIQFFIILGLIFTQLGMNLTALFTNKFNSPCHVFIIYAFGQIAYYIDFTDIFPLVFVLFIIILFISLIFTEIIEINLFGLSYNTKRNIMKRAEVDALLKDENLNDEKKECNNERENEKRSQSHNEIFIDNSEKDKNSSRQKSEHIIETENYFFKV